MRWFVVVLGLIGCAGTPEQKKAEIHKAEDALCALRAKEKALENLPDASTQAETQAK